MKNVSIQEKVNSIIKDLPVTPTKEGIILLDPNNSSHSEWCNEED